MEEAPTEYEVKGELSAPKPAKKKKRKWYGIVIDVTLALVFITAIAVSGNIIYLSAAYDLPFFVNGMSMYPTLNKDATDKTGKPLSWARGSNHSGDFVDYGYAKGQENLEWRSSLKRYDIVITYYPENYETVSPGVYKRDANGKLILRSSAKSKIKRIIGLPGETVKFDAATEDGDLFNRAWGKTTINPGQENEEVLKPLYTMADFPDVDGLKYVGPTSGAPEVTLGEDQYYVMGDNRSHSSDSRNVGAILGEMIVGKAYLVTGKQQLGDDLTPKKSWFYYFTPWTYRRIG